uniref:SMP-LTD domain-containing protein n=1 Tax=Oryza punctata TaxID=4537 RepID=A0A0E0K772_ORYPU
MALAFLLGFLLGLLALAALEAAALLWLVRHLRRRDSAPPPAPGPDADDLPGERPFPYEKQGFLWILEPEKTPKASNERLSIGGPKETKDKKNIVEVFPAKKSAKIKGHSLILSGPDGFHTTIKLLNCTVFAVSASSMPSRKWAKRYPIKLESKEYQIYNGSNACYLYAETSWEKESWCKALRLAATANKEKSNWHAKLSEEFNNYISSLNSEYPGFLKPTVFSGEDHEVMDRTIKTDGSSKVRLFLKKLAKKASTKVPLEGKTSSGSSTQGERKILDKLRSYQGTPFIEGLMGSQDDKSNSSSSQDTVKPSPTTPALGQTGQPSAFSDVNADDRIADEGTLCWNLLSSRLFFDAKMSDQIHKAIKARIQRTLSSMRTPSYVGDITLADFSLGKLPPYVHAMRVLPLDLNELWAFEVDFEYSSGILLHIETRLEVQEPELQKDIMKSNFGTDSNGEVESDLLESIEQYGNQFRDSQNSVSSVEEKGESDGSQPKSTGWTSAYISRWKNIMHSIADHVSQVPLSLAIKISSVRGVLRVHVKPPPSDQLWYGFTSMPDLEWDIESSIGDRKITNSHIGSLIGNRFKASLRDSLVLPNCESISIPFMLAEKDDWVPLKDAPFIWLNREPIETRSHAAAVTPTQPDEVILKDDAGNKTVAPSLPNSSARSEETLKTAASIDEPTQVPVAAADALREPRKSPLAPSGEASSPSSPDTIDELRKPLLLTEKIQEEDSESKVESLSPLYTSLRGIVPAGEQSGDESKRKSGRRARMMDFGKKMGDKLEEKRRHIEEKGRHIVEKMRENARTNSFDRSMTSSSHSNSQSQ